ncbi:bifunctional 5,10-methylene-tetrahydrofolate dehydrogenase/5,10-methylene-tetrahydrofolate cyclohydrolase [Halobellus salinus]|uniref:Bifunctional protein FolD n=1 Tax=Halobellus salinus TaxID=931585 RepID=A0A830EJ54_9EURY|nr:tetrahydrofolate dehydrogenase/cyclohydrolase catalytic domain-containing protein [Halobellus salinus]GGI94154.1 bifunctional 5,10-methylene-tetrahydrofolate dehydrogenase/5,10-methylene-tetrahydrofolate cyclohydrolase [Halobellus salinus]SMP19564.1 methenyltetrahydrofolate cyclohydrolase /5,10-methylenetetrahydrofolate dehydrogenase (NADP+) [Halobellus salinus]
MDQHAAAGTGATESTDPAPTLLDGNAIADRTHDDLASSVDALRDAGVTPTVALVSMTESGAGRTHVSMRQQACSEVGIRCWVCEIDPRQPAASLFDRLAELNDDPAVHGVSVQSPLPDHVDRRAAARRIHPSKDVAATHPENLGRLFAGAPRYTPPTPAGIRRLLDAYGIDTAGKRAVVVGRSETVGRPMATLLSGRGPGGDATTTVCHSRTENLARVTRSAEILVVAAGRPELVDAEMLSEGVVVVDVGINRVDAGAAAGGQVVGDVDFESAAEKAAAITPVPSGVGPLTVAMLLSNTVDAASRHSGVDVDLP